MDGVQDKIVGVFDLLGVDSDAIFLADIYNGLDLGNSCYQLKMAKNIYLLQKLGIENKMRWLLVPTDQLHEAYFVIGALCFLCICILVKSFFKLSEAGDY